MKTCSSCAARLPIGYFGVNASHRLGAQSACKPCVALRRRRRELPADLKIESALVGSYAICPHCLHDNALPNDSGYFPCRECGERYYVQKFYEIRYASYKVKGL